MKLSISNIGWTAEQDGAAYAVMKEYGFEGLEIAPTRIFPDGPYERLSEAREWSRTLKERYGFSAPSMQSIWFGRQEKIFGTEEERAFLIDYTKKAVDFAAAAGCGNLVFGCPRNRFFPDGADHKTGVDFFRTLGEYAASKGTVIGMEANPPIYGTNYVNDTAAALRLVEEVSSDGFRLNLDTGTMIYNGESADVIKGKTRLVSHVHISEPHLKPIERRQIHNDLKDILLGEGYDRFISVEMGKTGNMGDVITSAIYVRDVFR